MKIAVIGSSGAMGGFFARYFFSKGHEVVGSDPLAKKKAEFTRVRSNAEAVRGADAVLLAVPIDRTVSVARGLAPRMRAGSVLIEVSSVKGEILPALTREAGKRGLRLLSVHPLFGPSLSSSDKPKIAVITGRGLAPASARSFFPDAKLVRVTAQKHDKIMACVLSLTHIVSIAYAKAVASTIKPGDFTKAATPAASLQMAIARSVLSQDPKLYSRIAFGNRFTQHSLRALIDELVAVQLALNRGNRSSLEGLVSALADEYSVKGTEANEKLYRAFRNLGLT